MGSAQCCLPLFFFCSFVHKHSPSAIHCSKGKVARGLNKWVFSDYLTENQGGGGGRGWKGRCVHLCRGLAQVGSDCLCLAGLHELLFSALRARLVTNCQQAI